MGFGIDYELRGGVDPEEGIHVEQEVLMTLVLKPWRLSVRHLDVTPISKIVKAQVDPYHIM